MTPLQKMLVMGASLGIADQMLSIFPEPRTVAIKTVADEARLLAAENKRKLRAAKQLKRLEKS